MKIMKTKLLSTISMAVFALTVCAQGPNNSGTYYQAANGKKGAALKTALSEIIYNRTERSYANLWTDFQLTDVRADGKVWDMYSGISNFTFITDQDKGSGGNKEGEYYNREHSFPNSWFGGKIQPMYTDLHHMYPTDKLVNNKRGNNPFGETDGESFKSANGFSKLGICTYPGYNGMVFEPNDEYKGDFARTYFYMVTCYEEKLPDWYANYPEVKPTLDGKKYPGLSGWQLDMLMKWAADDPVSEKETARNNAVYDIQSNRNPFIDYPELEQMIWGNMTDVPFNYEEDPAGIRQMNARPQSADGWYSIDGRRLQSPPTRKGVYLNRGRKIVVR
jgi:endonuclease I